MLPKPVEGWLSAAAFRQIPTAVPSISGHSRRVMSRRYGPTKVCQMLVIDSGHDHDGERTARRHRDREQADRDRRQSEAEGTFDEAREQQCGGNEDQHGSVMATTLTRSPWHNLEVTEKAFVKNEAWSMIRKSGNRFSEDHAQRRRS